MIVPSTPNGSALTSGYASAWFLYQGFLLESPGEWCHNTNASSKLINKEFEHVTSDMWYSGIPLLIDGSRFKSCEEDNHPNYSIEIHSNLHFPNLTFNFFTKLSLVFTTLGQKSFKKKKEKKTVQKGANTDNQHFPPFPQCFLPIDSPKLICTDV